MLSRSISSVITLVNIKPYQHDIISTTMPIMYDHIILHPVALISPRGPKKIFLHFGETTTFATKKKILEKEKLQSYRSIKIVLLALGFFFLRNAIFFLTKTTY